MKLTAVVGCIFLFCLGLFCIGLLAYRLPKSHTSSVVTSSAAQGGLPGQIVETDPYGQTYVAYVGAPNVYVPQVEGAESYQPQYRAVYTVPRANETASAYAVRSGARAILCAPPDPYPNYRFFNQQIHFLERIDAKICPN